jgi:hypothetical protein
MKAHLEEMKMMPVKIRAACYSWLNLANVKMHICLAIIDHFSTLCYDPYARSASNVASC